MSAAADHSEQPGAIAGTFLHRLLALPAPAGRGVGGSRAPAIRGPRPEAD